MIEPTGDVHINIGGKDIFLIDEAPRHRHYPLYKDIARFLKQVPEDHLANLDHIILLDEAPCYDKDNTAGRYCSPANTGAGAAIVLFLNNTLAFMPIETKNSLWSAIKDRFCLWFFGRPFLASTLFHEIGHHYFMTVLHKLRETEEAYEADASAYQDEYLRRMSWFRLNAARLRREYLFVFGDRVRWFLNERLNRKKLVDAAVAHAKASREAGECEAAIKELTEAIGLDPPNDEVLFYRGLAYCRIGKYDDALRDFMRAVRLRPTCTAAYYYIGSLYGEMNMCDQAFAYFSRYVRMRPDDANGYTYRGYAYMGMKMNSEAGEDFARARSMSPEAFEPYYGTACLMSIENDPNEACKWLRQAIEKGFSDAERLTTDTDFDNIRFTSGYKEILGLLETAEHPKSQPGVE
jgi:tetratricopeptide (TPR) repeat protein